MIRVLIIDDDKLTRKGLISIVDWNACGMEVVGEAANGVKALDFLEQEMADLAVVDLTMPVMTGLDFIRESQNRWPLLRHVVLSFHEDFENIQSALRLGTLDYISKIRLDYQDCTKVFQCIAEMMANSAVRSQGALLSEDAPDWERLQNRWLALHWLYAEETLTHLWGEVRELAPSLRQMEHLMVRIREMVQKRFPCGKLSAVPELANIDEGLQWLLRMRDGLTDIAAGMDCNDNATAMLAAVLYIRSHLSETLSISDAAAHVNFSRSQFAANFKKAVGMTFLQYLQSVRIIKARQLLAATTMSAEDVSRAVGYEDVKYFSQLFTQYTGISTTEYRKTSVTRIR